jgi:3-keto-disaccharide hydrolase
LSKWRPSTQPTSNPTSWTVEDSSVEIVRKTGDLVSREEFGSCRLHLEFRTPAPPTGKDQSQGNSGVFLMSNYEMQVLDNTNNPTYADGMAGAVYGENPPLVDASRASGEWNYYDITFHRPVFDPKGVLLKQATVTAFLNGIKVQDEFKITGPTHHKFKLPYAAHPDKQPLVLQNHGQIVRFRNIWIVPIEE